MAKGVGLLAAGDRCSPLGDSGPHFVRPTLLRKVVEPNLTHVLGFESLLGNRENAAKWFE